MCSPKDQKPIKPQHKHYTEFEVSEDLEEFSILGENNTNDTHIDGHVIETDEQVIIYFTSEEAEINYYNSQWFLKFNISRRMVHKEWTDEEEIAAINEYLKYKHFLDKGSGDKKDIWDKIVRATNSKTPSAGKIKNENKSRKRSTV